MRFLNEKGLTVVELLVTVGLIGIVFTMFFNMISSNQVEIKSIRAKQDLSVIVEEMRTRISSQRSCLDALGTSQFFDESKAAQSFTGGDGIGHPIYFDLAGGESVVANQEIYGFGVFTNYLNLNDAEVLGIDMLGNKIYKVTLSGGFSWTHQDDSNYLRSLKIGTFFIKVNKNNSIADCFNINPEDPASVAAFSEVMCINMGGTYRKGSKACKGIGDRFAQMSKGNR